MTHTAPLIAKIFYKRIFTRFGLPKKIISDRDPRFTGAFWRRLLELTNTKLSLSTAYHPQSDGQTERTNRTLEQYLRHNVNYWQDNWDDYLPTAEFVINSSPNESTGFTPFELMYGKNPQLAIDFTDKTSHVPSAEQTIKDISESIKIARNQIIKSQEQQKKYADQHRKDHQFKIGDLVLLNNRNLNPADRRSRKLAHKWEGPFPIISKFGNNSFKLQLPNKMNIHATFHTSLLKPYRENDSDLFPNRVQEPPPPMVIDNQPEYEVEAILGSWKHRN